MILICERKCSVCHKSKPIYEKWQAKQKSFICNDCSLDEYKLSEHFKNLEKERKYKKGEKITSLDELMKQEFVYWNNKITHKGWFMSWMLRMADNAIKNGIIYKAIKKEGEEI